MGAAEHSKFGQSYKYDADKLFALYQNNKGAFKEHFKGKINVRFKNGDVLATTGLLTMLSMVFWQLLKKHNTPITMEHHASLYLDNGYLKKNIVRVLAMKILWGIVDHNRVSWVLNATVENKLTNPEEIVRFKIEEMCADILNLWDEFYNMFTDISSEYMSAIEMKDFIDVYVLPEIVNARANLQENEQSLRSFDGLIKDSLMSDSRLDNNMLAFFSRCGVVKMMQITQIIGTRGYGTDFGNGLFRHPSMENYLTGLRNVAYYAYESRSPAKAYLFAEAPLEDGAFFSRRNQLAAMMLKNIHLGDCGSKEHIAWKVEEKDIYFLTGSYFLDPATQKYKVFSKDCAKQHMGSTLYFRNALAGCNHADSNGICELCFGAQALNISSYSSAGMAYIQALARILIQLMLSVKHLDGTATTKPIDIPDVSAEYITHHDNALLYFRSDTLRNKKVKLVIKAACISALPRLAEIDLDGYDSQRINQLSLLNKNVKLEIEDDVSSYEESASISMKFNGVHASASIDLLKYIQMHGYDQNSKSDLRIDLTNWDYNLPFAALPKQHYTHTHFQRDFANKLESSNDKAFEHGYIKPVQLLKNLHTLISGLNDGHFKANMATLTAYIYPLCAQDPANGDYRLPKGNGGYVLPLMKAFDLRRSATGILSYQQFQAMIKNPALWDGSIENSIYRPPGHTMDSMFVR